MNKKKPEAKNQFLDLWDEWQKLYSKKTSIWSSLIDWFSSNIQFVTAVIFSIIILLLLSVPILSPVFRADLAQASTSRGIITYYFALGTISVIVLLVFSVITMSVADLKERFQPSKDLLMVLIGIFGTIIGFYFGTQTLGGSQPPAIMQAVISPSEMQDAGQANLNFLIQRGTPPYEYTVDFQTTPANANLVQAIAVPWSISQSPEVTTPLQLPTVSEPTTVTTQIMVRDSAGLMGVLAPGPTVTLMPQPQ